MNWIRFRSDQIPVNLDHIVTFRKKRDEKKFQIKFYFINGYSFDWDYSTEATRDEDYQSLIQTILHSEDTNDQRHKTS